MRLCCAGVLAIAVNSSFKAPVFDLCLAMLFCVAALFLSYRIICEQWFVWALPFLVVLAAAGRIRRVFVWGIISGCVAVCLFELSFAVFLFAPVALGCLDALVGLVHFVVGD